MNSLGEIVARYIQNTGLTATFIDAAVKSFVLLAIAGAVSLCWRRASAASRHLLWLLAVATLLCWPLLSFLTPTVKKPLWSVAAGFDSGNQVSLVLEFAPKAGPAPAQARAPA